MSYKKEQKRKWYLKNKESILAKARIRYLDKKEEIKKKNKERYYANRERILEQCKQYRETHKEQIKGKSLDWARRNPEKRKAIVRRYYEKKIKEDPEWANKKARKYYYRDPEKARKRLREYRKERPAWNRLQKYKRRTRCGSGQVDKEHLDREFEGLVRDKLESQGYKCVYCGVDIRENYSLDHIIPLSKGGTNEINNIDLVCKPCNTRKGTRDKEYFMRLIREDKKAYV